MPTFLFDPADADPRRTLFVDGTAGGFRSFSHWPGHTTPPSLRHDLSTGIALNWAALPPREREALSGGPAFVANNHYDTDGVLSAWIVLHPDAALEHRDLLLRAAATGDFCIWSGLDALAIDLTVSALPRHPLSPLARSLPPDADDHTRHERAYAWMFDALPALLGDPLRHRAWFDARLGALAADVARVDALLAMGPSDALAVERLPEHDLVVVVTDAPITMMALHRAAGPLWRVLHGHRAPDGFRHRFVYRDASWFDMESVRPLPRVPLEPAVAALQRAEDGAAGRPSSAGTDARWWCTSHALPVAELGFGPSLRRPEGFFADPELHHDPPSRLSPATVRDILTATLR